MYDTIKMHLNPLYFERGYLGALPTYLDEIEKDCTNNESGEREIKGKINSIKVTAKNYTRITIEGSLPKYLHGNNMTELDRAEVEQAINELSERLHIPLEHAKVSRIDIGANIEVTNPVEFYYPYLGTIPKWYRSIWNAPTPTLYIHSTPKADRQVLTFYDKLAEVADIDKQPYKGKNVVRYELRYLQRPQTYFKQQVTGAVLYDADFYNGIVDRWGQMYSRIIKNKDIKEINKMEVLIKTKQQNALRLIAFINTYYGGLTQYIECLGVAFKEGKISKQKKNYLKTQAQNAFKNKSLFIDNPLIDELTKKIADRAEQEKG